MKQEEQKLDAEPSRQAEYDVAIVGAGVVGSALAYALAKSGRKVALLERDLDEPDRIVGELLQPGGVRALYLLGLLDCLHGIDAVSVEGYHVFYGERSVPIPYPQHEERRWGKGIESSSGKMEGRSFHHGKFVQRLRKAALAQPNVTPYEATVRQLFEDDNGRVVGVQATRKANSTYGPGITQESDECNVYAPLTVVADGCFSKFRRTHGSTISPIVRSNFVGMELEHAPLPSPHHGHVVLGPSGPTLLYQISTEHTRILMDIAGEKLPSAGKGELQRHIAEQVVPYLPEQLQPCVLKELQKGQRLRSMPNSFLPPSMQGQNKYRKGVVLVGDAMNMRHPLTGGGMSVGLWDVVYLTSVLGGTDWRPDVDALINDDALPKDLNDWNALKPALRAWHWRRKGMASVINILAQALYSLFGADDENLEVLREGCFKYFELGGECIGGPVSLLSGLAPRPFLLFYHFFSVALYSIYALFAHPRKDPKTGEQSAHAPSIIEYPALTVRAISVFYTACVVLLPVVFTEMRNNVPTFKDRASSAAASASTSGSRSGSKQNNANSTLPWYGGVNTTYFAVAIAAIAAFVYSGQAGRPGSGVREIIFPGRFT